MLKLKELRISHNITQKQLAEKLNFTQTQISDWEVERSKPSLEYLCKIADFFEEDLDYLTGRKE